MYGRTTVRAIGRPSYSRDSKINIPGGLVLVAASRVYWYFAPAPGTPDSLLPHTWLSGSSLQSTVHVCNQCVRVYSVNYWIIELGASQRDRDSRGKEINARSTRVVSTTARPNRHCLVLGRWWMP